MVMFREDEQRMIAAERAAETRWKKILRRVVKWSLIIGGLFFLVLFILSGLGGKSESLKKGLEQYLMQSTGLVPVVGTLNGILFFPVMTLDGDAIGLYKPIPNAKPVKDLPLPHGAEVISVEHFDVGMAFWDMFFARRLIRALNVKNLKFESGAIDKRPLLLRSARLDLKAYKDGPALTVDGQYGDKEMKATLQMQRKGLSYGIPDDADFNAAIGDLRFAGVLKKAKKGAHWTFTQFGRPGITADLHLHSTLKQTNMDVEIYYNKNTVSVNVIARDKQAVKGVVKISRLDISDSAPLVTLAGQIATLWPDTKVVKDFVTDIDIAEIQADGKNAGALSFRLRKAGSALSVYDITGTIDAEKIGKSEGQIVLINRNDLKLSILAHPECMQGTLAIKGDDLVFDPLIMVSPNGRLAGTGRIGTQSVNAMLKPVSGKGCTP